jgi:hypothetical protein
VPRVAEASAFPVNTAVTPAARQESSRQGNEADPTSRFPHESALSR